MKDNLEFRAWFPKGSVWNTEPHMVAVSSIYLNTKKINYGIPRTGNASAKFEDIDLMQYTGLKDKNGVKIYEGDIVKAPYLDPIFKTEWGADSYEYTTIVVEKGTYCICYDDEYLVALHTVFDRLEVVGNKWENPELLKEAPFIIHTEQEKE